MTHFEIVEQSTAFSASPRYRALIDERGRVLRAQLAEIFASTSDFVWEIGCGHGHFLAAYARAHPDRTCIGIDLIGDRIARAVRKRDRARLGNLHFLHAEARLFLEMLPATARCVDIFVLFPDPWPKLRHHKHRLLQHSFLEAAAARATPECHLYFRTDFAPYYEATRLIIGEHPRWRLSDAPWAFEYETVFQSRADTYHSVVAQRRS